MDLDKVAAVLRKRRGMSVIDLGILLGRRFWTDLIKAWALLVIPLLIVVQGGLGLLVHPLLGVAAGWWLKPLFDRLSLHVISRGFFGDVPTTAQTLKATWRQWRGLAMIADLTWRRLSPTRVMSMCVRQLEGSSGAEARARIRNLFGWSGIYTGSVATLLFLSFKVAFYIALGLVVVLITPKSLVADEIALFELLADDAPRWVQTLLILAATTLVTTLVEPFFTAVGFGIYVQQRVSREGWDIEIGFRRLARRIAKRGDGTVQILLIAGVAMATMTLGLAPSAHAKSQQSMGPTQVIEVAQDGVEAALRTGDEAANKTLPPRIKAPVDDPQAVFSEMLEEPPFAERTITKEVWERKDPPADAEEPFRFEQSTMDLLAAGARIAMWIIGVLALLYVVFRIWRYATRASTGDDREARRRQWQQELASGDEALELPTDAVVLAARKAWEQGQHRRALAILLFNSLVLFEERHQFRFLRGWTTTRCAREVEDRPPEGPLVANLSRAFSQLAWAGRPVSASRFEELVAQYQGLLDGPGGQT